jgi:hypothetical protein
LEYEYAKETQHARELSCVKMKFSTTGFASDILTNFSFMFPPQSGNFYHVPTLERLSRRNPAHWQSQLGTGTYVIFKAR